MSSERWALWDAWRGRLSEVRSALQLEWRLPLVRSGYALLFSSVTSSALGMVFWAVAARLYAPEVVGLSSALVSALLLLSGIAQLGLNGFLVRFLPAAHARRGRWVAASYAAVLCVGALIGGAFVGGVRWWSPALAPLLERPMAGAIFTAAVALWSIFALQDSVLTGLRQAVWVPIENLVYSVLKILLAIALATVTPADGIALAWLGAFVFLIPPVTIWIGRILVRDRGAPSTPIGEAATGRPWRRFLLGNYIGSLAGLATTALLPVLMINVAGPEQTAHFYVPWMIFGGLQMIANTLSAALTVEAASDPARLTFLIQRTLRHSMQLLVPTAFVLGLGAPWIMSVFGASYGAAGSALLRWLCLAAVPNALVVIYLALARVRRHGKSVALILLAGNGASLMVGVVLIRWMGIDGIGAGWAVVQTLIGLMCAHRLRAYRNMRAG